MREIKFKAKRKNWKELSKKQWWVKGYYAVIGKRPVIIASNEDDYYNGENLEKMSGNEIIEIAPETICQYTGLNNKNGMEIYEGDILKLTHDDEFNYYGNERSASICCVVRYEETSFIVRNARYFKTTLGYLKSEEVEVIGNVWDNPELLEVSE